MTLRTWWRLSMKPRRSAGIPSNIRRNPFRIPVFQLLTNKDFLGGKQVPECYCY